jgi:hypothetical protein
MSQINTHKAEKEILRRSRCLFVKTRDDLTRSIPLVSPFGPTSGRSTSRLPLRSIVV